VSLVGGGIYLVTQFFKPGPIQILCDIHPPRISRSNNPAPSGNQPQFEIAFGFDQKYELTSLKVIALDEWTTNKQAHPLWHLVSESNSVPTKAFFYGQRIQGMHAAVAGARREPLSVNVTYRMLIEAGSRAGECTFKLPAPSPVAR
jgi:hypothetical protein